MSAAGAPTPVAASPIRACMVVWTDYGGTDADGFEDWYNREHMRDRVLGVAGFLSGRRFRMAAGAPRHLAVYEAHDPGVFSSSAYLDLVSRPDPRSRRFIPQFRNVVRTVARPLAVAGGWTGGTVGIAVMDAADRNPSLREALAGRLASDFVAERGIVRAVALETDAAELAATTRRHLRSGDRAPAYVLLVEGAAPADVARLREGPLADRALAGLGAERIAFGTGALVVDVRPVPAPFRC